MALFVALCLLLSVIFLVDWCSIVRLGMMLRIDDAHFDYCDPDL